MRNTLCFGCAEGHEGRRAATAERFPNNILGRTNYEIGNFEEAIQEPGLVKIRGWYDTPIVQHCHIENHICYAEEQCGARLSLFQYADSAYRAPHLRAGVGSALG